MTHAGTFLVLGVSLSSGLSQRPREGNYLFACLLGCCLLGCWVTCLLVCLHVACCLLACSFVCLHVARCLLACLLACMLLVVCLLLACLSACFPVCLIACLHDCFPVCLLACLLIYLSIYVNDSFFHSSSLPFIDFIRIRSTFLYLRHA